MTLKQVLGLLSVAATSYTLSTYVISRVLPIPPSLHNKTLSYYYKQGCFTLSILAQA